MEKITNPWNYSRMNGAEAHQRKIDRIVDAIANAERVLAWQVAEGYEPQAEYSRREIAKLQTKLAKLV
jgi:hypothetical protein